VSEIMTYFLNAQIDVGGGGGGGSDDEAGLDDQEAELQRRHDEALRKQQDAHDKLQQMFSPSQSTAHSPSPRVSGMTALSSPLQGRTSDIFASPSIKSGEHYNAMFQHVQELEAAGVHASPLQWMRDYVPERIGTVTNLLAERPSEPKPAGADGDGDGSDSDDSLANFDFGGARCPQCSAVHALCLFAGFLLHGEDDQLPRARGFTLSRQRSAAAGRRGTIED